LTFDKDYLLESRGKYYEVWLPLAPRPGKRYVSLAPTFTSTPQCSPLSPRG